jgi:hypothetical protein
VISGRVLDPLGRRWGGRCDDLEEFRISQASLPGQDAVVLLLFGLLRSGQVKLRKIDGWEEMARVGRAA